MKTKIATALSVVGVLAAGSAAALVNTQILDGPAASGASAAVLPPASSVDVTVPDAIDDTVPSTTSPETDPTVPATETTVETTVAPTTTAPPPSDFLTAFNVGEAGVVTVDVVDGHLILISAEPKDGWEVTETEESDDGDEVEVEFRSATVRVEFEAEFVDGRIVPHVESYTIGSSAPDSTAPSNTVPSHDDDDGDHDDDDDYDDDHDDDDDDDDDYDDEDDEDDEDDDDHDEDDEDEDDRDDD